MFCIIATTRARLGLIAKVSSDKSLYGEVFGVLCSHRFCEIRGTMTFDFKRHDFYAFQNREEKRWRTALQRLRYINSCSGARLRAQK